MTLYTSYFSFVQKIPPKYLISIAGKSPDGFMGGESRNLAPKYEWWKKWKDEKLPDEWYVEKYNDTVLSALNPAEVLQDIGDNKILLCYENPEKFCHRHLVAKWLRAYGVTISELTTQTRNNFIRPSL